MCTILQNSQVSEATGYGLKDWGSVNSLGRGFSLCHHVQTGSGVHPASYPLESGNSFSRGKMAGELKLTTHLDLLPRLEL